MSIFYEDQLPTDTDFHGMTSYQRQNWLHWCQLHEWDDISGLAAGYDETALGTTYLQLGEHYFFHPEKLLEWAGY